MTMANIANPLQLDFYALKTSSLRLSCTSWIYCIFHGPGHLHCPAG